jgi:integrase
VFDTEQDAADWGDKIEEEMRSGTFDAKPHEPPPKTVREMLQRYRDRVSIGKTRDGKDDRARIERLQAILGAYSVHALNSRRVTRYKTDRLEEGAGAQTVLHELVILHHAFKISVEEWGLELKTAIPRTRRPKLPPGRNFRISRSEAARIRLATQSRILPDIVDLAIETCMRRGEIIMLTADLISLENKTAYLPITKNGEARTVPLSSRALAILRPRVEAGMNPIFNIQPDSLTRAFCRAVRRIGLDHLRFHDTRHEGISRLFENGYSVIEAARVSGHKTLTQLDRYAHLDVKHIIEKMAYLGERDALEDAA